MNIHEANITGKMRKQQGNSSRIKHTNHYIRYQAENFARLEDGRHGLTEKQFKAIKCLFIKILRSANH
jgi:hypothetical protein